MQIKIIHDLSGLVERAVGEAMEKFPAGTSLEVVVETTEDLKLIIQISPLDDDEVVQ